MKRFFVLCLCAAVFFVSSSCHECLPTIKETENCQFIDIVQFDEIIALLSPYIGMNLEAVAKQTNGRIPNRNSMTAYSEDGECTIGRIGEYFGPISIKWNSDKYPIPLLRSATIGMSRSAFVCSFPLMTDGKNDTEYQCMDETIILVANGAYQGTKMTATLRFLFVDDRLERTELHLYEYGI